MVGCADPVREIVAYCQIVSNVLVYEQALNEPFAEEQSGVSEFLCD